MNPGPWLDAALEAAAPAARGLIGAGALEGALWMAGTVFAAVLAAYRRRPAAYLPAAVFLAAMGLSRMLGIPEPGYFPAFLPGWATAMAAEALARAALALVAAGTVAAVAPAWHAASLGISTAAILAALAMPVLVGPGAAAPLAFGLLATLAVQAAFTTVLLAVVARRSPSARGLVWALAAWTLAQSARLALAPIFPQAAPWLAAADAAAAALFGSSLLLERMMELARHAASPAEEPTPPSPAMPLVPEGDIVPFGDGVPADIVPVGDGMPEADGIGYGVATSDGVASVDGVPDAEAVAVTGGCTSAMQSFIPQEFLDHLEKREVEDLRLGDHVKKEMTIFFSDIRSFTELSESLTPEQSFAFINSYLSRVVPLIRSHRGFVDKYMGDGIMALFPEATGADDAVSSAVAMQHKMAEYNGHRANSGYRAISMGVGIHTGTLMMGVVGVADRMEGTVISDAVNLSSRLQSIAKAFNIPLVISERTFQSLSDPGHYKYRFIGKVRVKGKDAPVSVFEIFDGLPEDEFERKMRSNTFFEQGMLAYYRKDFNDAVFHFKRALQDTPADGASRFYLETSLRKTIGPRAAPGAAPGAAHADAAEGGHHG